MSFLSKACVAVAGLLLVMGSGVGAFNSEAEQYWPSKFHTQAEVTWSYNSADKVKFGPQDWSKVEGAAACAGQKQSPIDISTSSAVYTPSLTPLKLSTGTLTASTVINNGHAVQLNTNGVDNVILTGGTIPTNTNTTKYTLTQFHFHTNSEHTINGGLGAAELHFVFTNQLSVAKQLAVVGVIFKTVDTDNADLNGLISLLQKGFMQVTDNSTTLPSFALNAFIKPNAGFYSYQGSLTTPTCDEVVTWHVLSDMQTASAKQIAYLHNAMYGGENMIPYMLTNRPVQALNGRTVVTNVQTKMTSASTSTINTVGLYLAQMMTAVLSILGIYH